MQTLDALEVADRNRSRYLQAKEAFNRGDLDACLAFYAADHQIMSRPSPRGRDQIRAFLAGSRESWPDIQIVVEHAVAQGDWVMGRSRTTATHTATVFGVQPTNKRIDTTFWDLHRFDQDGLIVETWNLMDSLAIMGQLGLLPGPR
ncbi:ester cyclase [Piscinibacter gummiphilus]|uniref:Ester cyclase n=1 Tax=Piscinibacter gummiphilus TaxID=946333 RepID=A0ABZ0CZ92_9BURK|nr:ester cyclase [Piscinibacter gummiphilus]WOB10220.1 ester cyclase [Piscinibacter gummiphilus]